MANEVTIQGQAGRESPLARLQAYVSTTYGAIERQNGVDALPSLPTPEQRKVLEARRRETHAMLRPVSMAQAERDRAHGAILVFLGAYGVFDVQPTAKAYMTMISDQPLFAILAAIDDFRQGRVFDIDRDGQRIMFTLDKAPTAPRLLDQIKKRAGDVQEERHKLTRVLAVTHVRAQEPEISDAERERVENLMKGLAKNMAVKSEMIRVEERNKVRYEAQQARDRASEILQNARRRNEEAYRASVMEQATNG